MKFGRILMLELTVCTTAVCMLGSAPQVLDAMSDSTTSSTIANDLDLIYLKGIMESPLVWYTQKYECLK